VIFTLCSPFTTFLGPLLSYKYSTFNTIREERRVKAAISHVYVGRCRALEAPQKPASSGRRQ
jgi:hypothetical protein